jgi:hypothetical protein
VNEEVLAQWGAVAPKKIFFEDHSCSLVIKYLNRTFCDKTPV